MADRRRRQGEGAFHSRRAAGARAACGLLAALICACGSDIGQKKRGEPCTRDQECERGLVCVAGMCDSAARDGGSG
ncbi:MAG: hypothetical protein MJD61_16875 [Proteobacteria bacterium]|nr:hypothetical protein [Pseudomonadota bacterium]